MLSFQTAITHISSRIQTPDLKLIILIPVSHRDISSCPPAFSIHLYAVHKHNKYWKENRPILESIHKKHSNKWSLFISKPFIKSLSCWIWWVVLVKKKKNCHDLLTPMLITSQAKFCGPENISATSQQNSVAEIPPNNWSNWWQKNSQKKTKRFHTTHQAYSKSLWAPLGKFIWNDPIYPCDVQVSLPTIDFFTLDTCHLTFGEEQAAIFFHKLVDPFKSLVKCKIFLKSW